jgi:erythromycin esterase-like protein
MSLFFIRQFQMSRLLESYFQDVEDELEELQQEEEEENTTLQTQYEIKQEEEKFETHIKEIIKTKKPKVKKIKIQKQKTVKIFETDTKKQTIQESLKVQSFRPKIIKNFKTLDDYAKNINYKPEKVVSASSSVLLDDVSQIKRKNFASACDGSTLIIHGGEDEMGNSFELFKLIFRIG